MKYDIDSIKKRKELNRRIRKLVYIFIIIIIYNIILLSISYIDKFETPRNYIYKAYIITTNSMLPSMKAGDIVVIKRCKEEDLKKGSIVTFKQLGEIVTHRIIDITKKEQVNEYVTKGDNNNIEDAKSVKYEDIEGIKVIVIPYLGKIISILKSGIIIILVILLFLISYMNKISKDKKKKDRREKKKIEDKKSFT